MLITTMDKMLGIVSPPQTCCYCLEKRATIAYSVESNRDMGYLPYCAECVQDIAMGMMRDVNALVEGEEAAQKNHVAFLMRFRNS